MAHDDTHGHAHGNGCRRSLFLAFILTLGFTGVEVVGGWLTNSLALLSDAGHMLTDSAALGLSLLAFKIGEMPPSISKTFGYRRSEILAALLNGLALWGMAGVILHEAYERLKEPPEVAAVGMMTVAALGLAVNLTAVRLLHSHKEENLNARGAFLHVAADSLGSLGALLAGLILIVTGWRVVDPLVSVGICMLILWSSWGLVRDSVHILLLGVPQHIDYKEVEKAILEHEGVCCLYDLHIWTVSGGMEALSAHIVVAEGYPHQKRILKDLVADIKARFGIEHTTLQVEETHDIKNGGAYLTCRLAGAAATCGEHPMGGAANGKGAQGHLS